MLCYATTVEDVPDLTDGHRLVARVLYPIQIGLRRWGDAVVVAVLVLPLVGARLTVKRTGDDPFDHDLALADQHLVRLLGGLIQLIEWDHAGVRSDLEHRVGGCVEDPGTCSLLLGAELLNNPGPRSRPVADDPASCFVFEAAQHIFGETFRIGR